MTAEELVDAGQALLQLGRYLQKHYPPPVVEGSQFEEDEILAKLLPESEGTYVDIGANHPKDCSNTWKFYQRGWRGLLIEPLPECWGNLLLERREDRLCPLAASNVKGFATLRLCRSVSSLNPEWNTNATETMPVQTDTLSSILSLYKDRDWSKTKLCSIDVEGHEKEVLEGINWSTFHPKVIVIEYRDYHPVEKGDDVSGQWVSILRSAGYSIHHKNGLNQIWRR